MFVFWHILNIAIW